MRTPAGSDFLSHRLEGVQESATLKLNAMAQALRAQGVDVVNLTAGEPDFDVPEAAKAAVIKALKEGRNKYTPVAGIPELRELVAKKANLQQPAVASHGGAWSSKDVVVSNGGKQALFNSFLALLNPGDEVLIPAPYWLSYPEMVKLAGGVPKFIASSFESGFKITPEQLRTALAPGHRVKMLVLNSPSNPTGAMYSREEFAALGRELEAASAKDVWVISDEIYDRLVFGGVKFCSFLDSAPQLRDRCITVNGMSKSAAMTGWRIGWTVAPPALTQALITLQGQSTSGINALAQWASVAALELPESEFDWQVRKYVERRDLALEILSKAGKIRVKAPDGAFYFFLGIGECLRPGEDAFGFCERALAEANVALVPGTPFGEPEFVRISFATDEKSLAEGCRRLVSFCS